MERFRARLLWVTVLPLAAAQCLSLTGSTMCPSFQNLSIDPTTLVNTYAFFDEVTDVASFDSRFAEYVLPGGSYAVQKQLDELGCTGWDVGRVLQYQRTFLCGQFTSNRYSQSCNNQLQNSMVCRSTCEAFATSESRLLLSPDVCPTNPNASLRNATLSNDYTRCTDYDSAATNDTATCVQGKDNEANCGYAESVAQLCNYCNPATKLVDACCVATNSNVTAACGFTIAAAQVSTTSSSTMSPTTTASSSSSSATSPSSAAASPTSMMNVSRASKLSKGAIAGAVVGSVLGALLLLALLLLLLLMLRRRRRKRSGTTGLHSETGESIASEKQKGSAGPQPTKLGSSDKALAGVGAAAGAGLIGSKARRNGEARPLSNQTLASAQTEDSRNTVAQYQDTYSTGIITPGSEVEAVYAYNPTMPDELALSVGDQVQVLRIYDDNWAQGVTYDSDGTERSGAFPLVCVTAALSSAFGSSEVGSHTSSGPVKTNPTASDRAYMTAGSKSLTISDRSSSRGMGSSGKGRSAKTGLANVSGDYFPSRKR